MLTKEIKICQAWIKKKEKNIYKIIKKKIVEVFNQSC